MRWNPGYHLKSFLLYKYSAFFFKLLQQVNVLNSYCYIVISQERFFQMCICFIQEFKVQNQSHRAHYSQGFCQRKNCNTVIFPAAPPSVPAVRGPPQGRSKKVVTGKTHNEHCPAQGGEHQKSIRQSVSAQVVACLAVITLIKDCQHNLEITW